RDAATHDRNAVSLHDALPISRPRNPCRTHPGMRRSHTDGGSPMGRMIHTQWITAASGPRTDGGWPDAHRACSGERDEIGVVGAPQVLDAVREQDDPLRLERLDGALEIGRAHV